MELRVSGRAWDRRKEVNKHILKTVLWRLSLGHWWKDMGRRSIFRWLGNLDLSGRRSLESWKMRKDHLYRAKGRQRWCVWRPSAVRIIQLQELGGKGREWERTRWAGSSAELGCCPISLCCSRRSLAGCELVADMVYFWHGHARCCVENRLETILASLPVVDKAS